MAKLLDYVPEVIAQLSYVTCGLAFGYLFYMPALLPVQSAVYFWPFLIGIIIAILFCGIGSIIVKHTNEKETFVHFYLIAIGQLCLLICGCLFYSDDNNNTTPSGMFMAGIGHAFTYIWGISFVNVRAFKYRTARIALCHCFYFVGVLLAVLELNNGTINVTAVNPMTNIGFWMILCSCILIALIIINELLHFANVYNYKKSLHYEFNVANNNRELMVNRSELIEKIKKRNTLGWSIYVGKNYQKITQFWLPLLKLNGFLLFSYITLYWYGFRETINFTDNNDYTFIPQTFMIGGSLLGVLITLLMNSKWIYLLCNSAQIIALLISILYGNGGTFSIISLWIYFGLSAVSYCIADISILEITHLKYTELMLSIGYLIEIVPIAVFQFYTLYDQQSIWLINDLTNFMIHSTIYIFVTITLMILVVAVLTKKIFKMNLLQIKYHLFNIRYFQHNNQKNFGAEFYGNNSHSEVHYDDDQPTAPTIDNNNNNNNNNGDTQHRYQYPNGGAYRYEPNRNFEIFQPTYQLPRVHLSPNNYANVYM